jgi:hypothetical protein
MDRRDFISATIFATAAGAATAFAGDRLPGTTEIAQNNAPTAPGAAHPEHHRFSRLHTITLEEHYFSPAYLKGPGRVMQDQAAKAQPGAHVRRVFAEVCDLSEKRIALMDEAAIDVQVLSQAPGVEQLEPAAGVALARATNDYLLETIGKFPTRYAGFATMPTSAPKEAAKELERMIQLGFKGAIINGHSRGRYLDDKFFWPMLETAEGLNVPIYLHPTPPPKAIADVYYAGFGPEVTDMFSTAGWGWHIETAAHVARMMLGGVFDQFPKLQIIVGHLGETLSFMLPRMDRNLPMSATGLKRPINAYLRENLHYTFSGFNFTAGFLDLLMEVGADRIMFSADHPYASMMEARTFLEHLPVSAADREKIAHGNAERLLKM